MVAFNDLLTMNPVAIGFGILLIVVIASVVEKRQRNSSLSSGGDNDSDPLSEEDKLEFPTEEDAAVEAEDDPNDGNYFPEPPSDLMPSPMNAMTPVF